MLSATDGTLNAAFAYYARNRQVSRTIGGVTTWFYYDGWTTEAGDSLGETAEQAARQGETNGNERINLVEEHTATSGQSAVLNRAYLHGTGVTSQILRSSDWKPVARRLPKAINDDINALENGWKLSRNAALLPKSPVKTC